VCEKIGQCDFEAYVTVERGVLRLEAFAILKS
jgi:hypothetical protein